MNKNKIVAFLLYDITLLGGAENITLQLANELSNIYEVHIISLFKKNDSPIIHLDNKIRIHYLSLGQGSISRNIIRFSYNLSLILKSNKVSLLFSITAGPNEIAWLASKLARSKWIYCEHSNLENQTYGKIHYLRQYIGAKFSDHIVCLTQRDFRNFVKKLNVSERKLSVIPNFVDFNKFYNESYNIRSKKIISVGRLVLVKQFDHIIMIGKYIFNKYQDWIWNIYGDGELKEDLQNLINKNNLENHIFLRGKVNNIMEILPEHSFLVMTSKYEGLPLSLLEAQFCKLPIISYDCPTGPGEIISDNKNGFLIEEQNLKEMQQKIDYLISNSDCRLKFSKNACLNLDLYKKENVLKSWIKLINSFK